MPCRMNGELTNELAKSHLSARAGGKMAERRRNKATVRQMLARQLSGHLIPVGGAAATTASDRDDFEADASLKSAVGRGDDLF